MTDGRPISPGHGVTSQSSSPPHAGAATDIEAHDRDAAFAAAGWDASPVNAWNIEELAALVAEGAPGFRS
jgi:hypothetical protein